MRQAALWLACMALAGCGFHLRVEQPFAFDRLYLSGADTSPVVNDLRRVLATRKGLILTDAATGAQATLQIVSDAKEKIILSLTGAGLVREYQLRQRVSYILADPRHPDNASPGEISVNRTLLYSDTEILAKQSEETLLYRDMETDVVQQILRRMAAFKPAS